MMLTSKVSTLQLNQYMYKRQILFYDSYKD